MGVYHRGWEAMNARFAAWLDGADDEHLEAVAVAVEEEVGRLDRLLSRFDPRSEIARVNREAAVRPVRVEQELFALLARCEAARQMTDGCFDITRTGRAALELDAEAVTVQFTHIDITLDLGGIGKGYALDCAREILLRFGVTRALLHGGTSSVLALDATEGTTGWTVDLRHPLWPEVQPVAKLVLENRALSCSTVRHGDVDKSDVVDPATGRALEGNAACVVLAASATEAEIFSTALLAMGRARAVNYLCAHPQLDVQVRWSESGENFVGIG